MSAENLKEYVRRCAQEPDLRVKAKEIGTSDLDAHIHHSKSLGLDWTESDMNAFRKELIDAEGEIEALGDEQLEQVAGGIITVTAAVTAGVVAGAVVAGAAAGTAAAGATQASGDGGW